MKAHLWEHMKRDWQGEGMTERGREVSVGARRNYKRQRGEKKRNRKGSRERSVRSFRRLSERDGTEKWDGGANNNFWNKCLLYQPQITQRSFPVTKPVPYKKVGGHHGYLETLFTSLWFIEASPLLIRHFKSFSVIDDSRSRNKCFPHYWLRLLAWIWTAIPHDSNSQPSRIITQQHLGL